MSSAFLPFLILLIIYLPSVCCALRAQALSSLMGVSEVLSRPQEQQGALLFLEQGRAGIAGGCCPRFSLLSKLQNLL